jgi:hypothetical protein
VKPSVIAHRFAVYTALCTVALAQPLLQLYSQNVAIFAAANYEGAIVVWFALAVLVVPPLVLLAVDVLAQAIVPRFQHTVHYALVFVGLWAVVSVIARSVSFGPWVVDAVFTAVIAAGLLTAFLRLSVIKSWIALLSPLALVVALVFGLSAMSVISPPEAEVLEIKAPTSPEVTGPGTPKDDVSVLWIVLDEAPLFSLLNSQGEVNAQRFPGFAELAATSTWYRNVLATSQTTTDAVPAMLTGKFPKSGVGPVLANHPKNLFTLMNGHLSMDAHEVVTALCPKKVCSKVSVTGGEHIANPSGIASDSTSTTLPQEDIVTTKSRTPFSSFMKDAFVVVGHKVLPQGLREKLPAIDEGWGGFGNADNIEEREEEPVDITVPAGPTTTLPLTEETKQNADNTTVTEWEDGGPQTQIPVVEGAISRAAQADRPTLHFAHALIPHRPWVLAPDMRASVQLPADKRSIQVLDGRRDRLQIHLSQYAATDVIISNMLSTMKKSANWNRTMIIVTADHGITFQQGEKHRETVNVKSSGTLEDLYRVPLFIKYPDQNSAAVSDCTASPVDLLATVSAATGIDAGWTTDGADLRTACPQRSERTIIWPDGSHKMSTTFTDVVKRVKYYDAWIDADGNIDDIYRTGLSGSLVGTPVPVSAETESGIRWSLKEANTYQTAGSGRFAPVVTRSRGTLSAARTFSENEEALLVLDGVVFGVVSELAGLKKGTSTEFTSIPMSRLHTPGTHTIELWVADWSNPAAPVLKRVAK